MKTAEERMKKLPQKLIEYGKNYTEYGPVHDELEKSCKTAGQTSATSTRKLPPRRVDLWNAASRYLHANLPKGTKTLPIAEWEQEYADLKTQRDSDYAIHDTGKGQSPLSHHAYHAPPLTSAAHGRQKSQRNMTLMKTASVSACQAADTRRTKVDLTGWNDRATPTAAA